MSSLDKRETGSIKWYHRLKGYGFIIPDSCRGSAEPVINVSPDVFFHITAIAPEWGSSDISPGVGVEYSVERDEVGRLRAVQVTRRKKGACFACGKAGHHVKDCKDTSPGQAVTFNRRMAWGSNRKCSDCGEMGHVAWRCPRRQASPSLGGSDIWDESSMEQRHHGRPGGEGTSGSGDEEDDDDDRPRGYVTYRWKSWNYTGDDDDDDDDDDDGHLHGDGAAGLDDDDCVILEQNPFVPSKSRAKDWKKAIQNLIDEFSDIPRKCKRETETDTDEEESTDDCVLTKNKQQEEESDDDCIVLEKNPLEEDIHETIINMSNKLSLSSNVRTMFSVQQQSDSKLPALNEGLDQDELVIVAEKGQVACRDYPHSRHLCVKYPFNDTPHHTYCNLCYCYVCDIKAPCKYWETEKDGHCHASEQEFKWVEMRLLNRAECPIS